MSKGSQYVCQQCSLKETSSDIRGPKLESKSYCISDNILPIHVMLILILDKM